MRPQVARGIMFALVAVSLVAAAIFAWVTR
jgi:hypothetical protein